MNLDFKIKKQAQGNVSINVHLNILPQVIDFFLMIVVKGEGGWLS